MLIVVKSSENPNNKKEKKLSFWDNIKNNNIFVPLEIKLERTTENC